MTQRIPCPVCDGKPFRPLSLSGMATRLWIRRRLKRRICSQDLTVALVLIPQSMAYAQLAGLPSYYGLYAAFLPPAVAALLGSSRQLATGPVAVVSLMTAVAFQPLAVSGSQAYIAYAVILALMVGQLPALIMGLLRLGLRGQPACPTRSSTASPMPPPSSSQQGQLPKLFGVTVDTGDHHFKTVIEVFKAAGHYTHWPTLMMGVFAFAVMLVLKKISLRIPNVLVAVAAATLISWATGFEQRSTMPLESVVDADARALIVHFNAESTQLAQMGERRARINDTLKQAKIDGHRMIAINSRRDLDILNYQMELRAMQAADHRHRIRRLLFEAGRNRNNGIQFFAKGGLPPDAEKIGGTFRLIVGNAPLDSSALVFCSGGEVVGAIPTGLPHFSLPEIDGHGAVALMPPAVIIALLGFMEAISIAKAMAAKTGQRIDPNRELIGPGTGQYDRRGGPELSRGRLLLPFRCQPAVRCRFRHVQCDHRPGCAGNPVFFHPLLYHLPQSVLAAIIMVAVAGLVNVQGFVHAWRAQWYDGAISVITFVCTLAFAPHLDRGILVGVGLSLSVFLYRSMRPHVADLSLGLDEALHDAVTHGLRECRYIDVVRFDGPLFFANASYLEEQIRHRRKIKKHLKHIIIAAESISDMDASGLDSLSLDGGSGQERRYRHLPERHS
jgi:SulP family sulfate permease